jgi:hypothetical protein
MLECDFGQGFLGQESVPVFARIALRDIGLRQKGGARDVSYLPLQFVRCTRGSPARSRPRAESWAGAAGSLTPTPPQAPRPTSEPVMTASAMRNANLQDRVLQRGFGIS